MPVVNGKHYPYTPEGKAQAKDAATQFGVGDVMKLVGASSNKFKLSVGKGQGYNRKGKYVLDRDAPGGKYGPGYEPTEEKSIPKGGAPFKLASGNTTPFKMMGSSPAKIFGIGGGGGGGKFGRMPGVSGIIDKIRAKREAKRAKRLGLTPGMNAPGGGSGAHTHGTGGEPIAQAAMAGATAETAVPVEPGVEEEEVV